MNKDLRPILYVDDEVENLETFMRIFRNDYDVMVAPSGEQALKKIENQQVPVIIADQRMPGISGLNFLEKASKQITNLVGIILTAYTDVNVLVDAVNSGCVYKYITKPWKENEIRFTLKRAFERYDLICENQRLMEELKLTNEYLKDEIKGEYNFEEIIGKSALLKDALRKVEKVAKTDSTVLVHGESGTGKELIARAIHFNSKRKDKVFVKVNCGALAENLLESELFGHEKGAFTGAVNQRMGRFELANKGTIFLDEIGDVSKKMQVNLLRVLQEKQFERVGGAKTFTTDVRIIAATNKNLSELIEKGEFREDLYYRLNIFPIDVPPLREKADDISLLVDHFLQKYKKLSKVTKIDKHALSKLQTYDWPGNVRELENIIERAMILADEDTITESDIMLPEYISKSSESADFKVKISDVSKELIQDALRRASGSKTKAAQNLGMKRTTFYYHLKRLGIEK